MKTGNTWTDRLSGAGTDVPQWSPVMKTGNTQTTSPVYPVASDASMEHGHEDREYVGHVRDSVRHASPASMEPGHEDREYMSRSVNLTFSKRSRLNGARS